MSVGGSVFIPLVAGLHVNEGLCLVCVPRTLSLYLHKLGSGVTPAAALAGVRSVVACNKDIIMFSVGTWMLGLPGPGGTQGWY